MQVRRLINQGVELAKAERHIEAAGLLRDAAEWARLNFLQDEELQALLTLSACYFHTDEAKVRPALERAMTVAKSLGDLTAQGKCHLNLSGVTKDRIQAIKHLRLALRAFERSGHKHGCAQALDNLAVWYRVLGSTRSAIAYTDRARQIFRELRDPFAYAKNLRLSGDLLTDLIDEGNEPDDLRRQARANYAQAMSLFEAVGAPTSYASCRDVLGLLERHAGNLPAAIEHHEQALSILTWERAPRLHTSVLLHLAAAYQQAERLDDALKLYPRVIELKRILSDDAGVLNALHNQAVLRIEKGEYQKARVDLLVLVEQRFQEVRSNYYPDTRGGLLQEYANGWSSLILASARLIGQPPDRGAVVDLWVSLEQSKFNVIGRGMSVASDAAPDGAERRSLLKQELLLRRRRRELVLSRQRHKQALEANRISKAAYDGKIDRLIARNFEVTNRLHQFYARHPPQAGDADFKSYCAGIEQGVKYALASPPAEQPDAVYLHLFQFAGRGEILAAAVTKEIGHVTTANLSAEMLEAVRADYGEVLTSPPGSRWETRLCDLAQRLGEILECLQLGSLFDGRRPVVLSASSIWQSMPWQIAALGPDYLGTRCAFTRSLSLAASRHPNSPSLPRGRAPVRTAHLYSPEAPDLAHSAAEVDALAALLTGSGLSVSTFRDSSATAANLTGRSLVEQPGILHFAGHSEFDTVDSGLSQLVLSQAGAAPNELTALEIEAMHPPRGPQFVYLSSCNSGLADNRPGDELIGLAKAFMALGTEAFACTSWATLDSSAIDMSLTFYQALVRGDSVAGAAQSARRQVRAFSAAGKYPEQASLVHWGALTTFSRVDSTLT